MMLSYDNDCPTGIMYMCNPQFLKLAYAKGHWYKGHPAVEPANQTVRVFKVHAIANMISTNNRMLGAITGIT